MKSIEKKKAKSLREKGLSVKEIADTLKCSKSSVSRWVMGIKLTDTQIDRLRRRQAEGRSKAANHPNSPKNKWQRIRDDIIHKSAAEITPKSSIELLRIVGAALYWAEGYNAGRNLVIFANSDPRMITLMMVFFRKVCKVPEKKFRGRVNIHPHLDIKKAERYWSKISDIPVKQFHRPLIAVSRSSQGKRDSLPLGTFRIVISDVVLCSRIKGWIEGLSNWAKGRLA